MYPFYFYLYNHTKDVVKCAKLNRGKIEVRISLVMCNKGGQPLRQKGGFAEGKFSCPGKQFWDVVEYATYCHIGVEGYHKYNNLADKSHRHTTKCAYGFFIQQERKRKE